ncbi:MAG TPA: cation:proton antiporter [Magnetospirillaceae bacterium]
MLLLLIGRGIGEIMQRFGQPAVIGQLLAGLILGPSLFGWVWPEAHSFIFPKDATQKSLITGLSDVGVLLLLLLTGMETDLKLVRKVGAPAIATTVMGIAAPFAGGFALGQFIPDSLLTSPAHRLIASLFLGTALSISSIKIVAMVVREMNFMRRNLGQIIVASSIMEDTTCWVIISLILGIARSGQPALGSLAVTVIGTAVFIALSYTLGRRVVFWLIRYVNDTFVSEYAVITAILIVMCVMALITQAIGVNTVLGAFVAGVLIGESPILSQHIEDQLRGFITAFMMPIFFGLSGLSADLTILRDGHMLLLTLGVVAVASVMKFGGAFSGGLISRLTLRESFALGCGMNARGSTEVIVATIGLSMGALTQNLYTMIVTMAVLTTMAMPPMLRGALKSLPMNTEEKRRLEQERVDALGFLGHFERVLTAIDESPNGQLASHLAGFIAGQRGKPVTVLHFGDSDEDDVLSAKEIKIKLTEVVAGSALEGGRSAQEMGDAQAGQSHVQTRVEDERTDTAVIAEAEKGYDILFVGLAEMSGPGSAFSAELDRVAASFKGPLVLVIADRRVKTPEATAWTVLAPFNGTEASRRGAEVALAFASARDNAIEAVIVAEAKQAGRRTLAQRDADRAIIGDLTALAGRYGQKNIAVTTRTDLAPDQAIIEQAERMGANVIVMGASRRVGEALYLGETVEGVLRHWKQAIVLVVT